MSKNKIFRIVCFIIFILATITVFVLERIDNSAYYADANALTALESSKYVNVEETVDYIAFEPAVEFYNKGIIFYPGGSVEPEAYAPLMHAVAEEGYLCIIMKMPLKLSVLDTDKADKAREDYSNVADWYMAGHSLGGAMAAGYAHENASQIRGLILLAAYSIEDLTKDNLNVLSIYGSMDCILDMEKYEACRSNLPTDMKELVINGGNHANFGNYGAQKGDGVAKVSPDEQRAVTAEAICEFLEETERCVRNE